ncbi:unnamed protein product [Miscanthus lutarioriparius]|uniref:Receptor-like serine/threonine-protein kinase n=1 Tax=Miscanthus lutarioriparius TaxID=422564 RepID=A0A811RYC4_9POAL|nr:unnamed protein product [Miscanthus lutarioriparius]
MNPLLHILLTLLLFTSLDTSPWSASAAAATDTLTAGQALAFGDKLVSRNGKFALGFFQPTAVISKSRNITSPNWYLGIWFNKIPVFTTVWVANREAPIADSKRKQTHLKISSDGNNLIIVTQASPETETTVWSTPSANRSGASSNTTTTAVLLDSGNLALLELESPSSSNVTLWQSFDYPTDIVLPGAKFGRNKVTGFSRRAITWKSLIDPGLGSYSIEIDTTGVVLKHRSPSVVYWHWSSSSTSTLKLIPILKSILELDPRTKGLIDPTYVDNSQEEYYMYTSLNDSSLTFVSLDISGQIKMNVWSHAQQSWQAIYAQPVDPCTPYATCGPFTTCNGTSSLSFCDCMPSFSQKSPQDWELDDRTGGCIRNTPLHCTSEKNMTSSTDIFRPIPHVTLPYNSQSIDGVNSQSNCEEACLSSCSCTAYSYNSSRCSVWHGELFSVNHNDGIDNNSEDVLYLRLAADDLPSLTRSKRKPSVGVVTAASIIGTGLLMLMLLLMMWRKKFKWCGTPLYDTQGGGVIAFRYTDLSHATKNFSEKLGAGGFGCVFKGVLSGSTTIAVKRLDGARQGEKQFRAEVSSLGLIQHISLVRLIGFCCEGDKRLLVYEHMSNGSLDSHLFQSNAAALNWNTRYQIAIGVARGLSYLHQSCQECIIHCDIKPENILLDTSFVPKIADFGMAAFVGRDFSRVLTTFRGTAGYLAPEWLGGVAITSKVDVYSFGLVLLEIISGRRNSPEAYSSNNYHIEYFPVRAVNKLHEGDVRSLVDPQLHDDFNLEEVERVCKVACWCIQDNELHRPTMGEVVRVLEGQQEIDMPQMPRLLAAITQGTGAITESSNASSM